MQDIVRVSPADPGHGPLVAQDGVGPPGIVALADERRELIGEGLGAQLRQGPLVAWSQHPPPGLALRPELLDQ